MSTVPAAVGVNPSPSPACTVVVVPPERGGAVVVDVDEVPGSVVGVPAPGVDVVVVEDPAMVEVVVETVGGGGSVCAPALIIQIAGAAIRMATAKARVRTRSVKSEAFSLEEEDPAWSSPTRAIPPTGVGRLDRRSAGAW